MTEPRKSTSAKASARAAADEATAAATEAKEAVKDTARATRMTVKEGFAAVRDNEDVRKLTSGTREFLRKAEDPALIVATAINPLAGLGATGVIKGSRLLVRGLKGEARIARTDTVESE